MCGIAGILHPDAENRTAAVRRMLDRIRHRGPDDDGLWRGGNCALGHARLAIIDLSPRGRQPMGNEDGSIWVVLNGEIYNYRELRADLLARGHCLRGDSDTEVLPHLYEEYGADFPHHLRGMFAIALWDARRRRLILARDRAGKKPLFYAAIPGGLAFASEMKALFVVPGIDCTVRQQAIHDYLGLGTIPGPETAYSGIRRVQPAHVLVADADGDSVELPYWSLSFAPKRELSYEEAAAGIDVRLREATRIRLRSDVPVGCFLSGGIDSGLIVAMAARASSAPLKTYAVGFEESAFDERGLARAVAARYGTEHAELLVTPPRPADMPAIVAHYDEPYSDPSMLPSFAIARRAAQDIKVVLNGDGADEIFAGYRHVIAARLLARLGPARGMSGDRIAALLQRLLPAPAKGRTVYQFIHRAIRAGAVGMAERCMILTGDRLTEAERHALYGGRDTGRPFAPTTRLIDRILAPIAAAGPVDRSLGLDFHLLLAADHLVKMDMASMAFGLEARSPFLDHELIEFAASLPEDYKSAGWQTKPLLRTLAGRLLPPAVAAAPKRGFEIPLQRWMQHDLNPLLHERILDPTSYAMTHFDRHALRRLLSGDGWDAKRWAAVAWMLLCLEFWWDNYRNSLRPAALAARHTASDSRAVA